MFDKTTHIFFSHGLKVIRVLFTAFLRVRNPMCAINSQSAHLMLVRFTTGLIEANLLVLTPNTTILRLNLLRRC